MSSGRLRMYLPRLDPLPLPDSPAGYAIRRFVPGEERVWWQLLDEMGDLGTWDATRAAEEFTAPSGQVWKESIHFAVFAERVVGTACVQMHAGRDDVAELGWVAVAGGHRGRGLGRVLSLHVMGFMRRRGYSHCFVQTRSRRTAAVNLFRDLGFQPWGDPNAEIAVFLETLPRRPRTETQA